MIMKMKFFFGLNGTFKIEFRDKIVEVKENEFIIVPRGVEHRPIADNEVSAMVIEPCSTLNTGDSRGELTREKLERI